MGRIPDVRHEVLVTTGGTIAWIDSECRMATGLELAAMAQCDFNEIVDATSVPSYDLDISGMMEVVNIIKMVIDRGATSVVVTHGTDTVEETSWLTELMLTDEERAQASVVFTGAMRFADDAQSDGSENLRGAQEFARTFNANDDGVVVSFAGQRHAARWVRKVDASLINPFTSMRTFGEARRPPRTDGTLNTDVALVKVGPIGPMVLPAGLAGIVIEGTGAAHVPSRYHQQLGEMDEKGTAIVLASRCIDVDRTDVRSPRMLYAGDLTPEKAALALMAALAATSLKEDLRDWWHRLSAG